MSAHHHGGSATGERSAASGTNGWFGGGMVPAVAHVGDRFSSAVGAGMWCSRRREKIRDTWPVLLPNLVME